MKLVHVLLINLATVAVVLVVYDQLRSEASDPSQERASRPRVTDTAALERRLQALEADRAAAPRAAVDSGIFDRLAALEAAVLRDPETGGVPAMERHPDDAKPTKEEPRASMASADVPGADDVRRFRTRMRSPSCHAATGAYFTSTVTLAILPVKALSRSL